MKENVFSVLNSPYFKISCVVLVCAGMIEMNYLLFNSFDFNEDLKKTSWLLFILLPYFLTVFYFAQFYLKQKKYFFLLLWLLFNSTLAINFSYMMIIGNYAPIYIQYSQSSSLLIYSFALFFSHDTFPNWLRIFSLSCFLILIPCLIYYFTEWWNNYEITIYVLCLTPIIKAFVFLKEIKHSSSEILDDLVEI